MVINAEKGLESVQFSGMDGNTDKVGESGDNSLFLLDKQLIPLYTWIIYWVLGEYISLDEAFEEKGR